MPNDVIVRWPAPLFTPSSLPGADKVDCQHAVCDRGDLRPAPLSLRGGEGGADDGRGAGAGLFLPRHRVRGAWCLAVRVGRGNGAGAGVRWKVIHRHPALSTFAAPTDWCSTTMPPSRPPSSRPRCSRVHAGRCNGIGGRCRRLGFPNSPLSVFSPPRVCHGESQRPRLPATDRGREHPPLPGRPHRLHRVRSAKLQGCAPGHEAALKRRLAEFDSARDALRSVWRGLRCVGLLCVSGMP